MRQGEEGPESDTVLVTRLRTDPEALEAFYRRHVADVAAFIARRVSDANTVADVVSATFLAAVQGAAGFDPDRSPGTALYWMLRIARNEVANHHRQAERQRDVALREGAARRLSDDETARIDDLIDAQRLAPQIQKALEALSPRVSAAFLLVEVDGVRQRSAAVIIGISDTALRARLTRARRHLRRHLQAGAPSNPNRLALIPTDPGDTHGI
jgi:RNA polymerase sigma factor (sigma-70 family)